MKVTKTITKLGLMSLMIFQIGVSKPSLVYSEVTNDTITRAEAEYQRKEELRDLCRRIFPEYNIDPNLGIAIMERESNYKTDAVGGKYSRCVGLMQVSTKWQGERAAKLGITDLFDPESNVRVAADYIRELFEKYEDPAMVLLVYRYGYTDAKQYYDGGIWDPAGYAKTILERAHQLDIYEEAILNGTAKG